MYPSKRNFIVGISLLLIIAVIFGCLPNKQGGFSCVCAPLLSKIKSLLPLPTPKTPSNTPGGNAIPNNQNDNTPQGPGTISTGQQIELVSQTVGTAGATITVAKPGDPMNGLQIAVPPGAYPDIRTFKVSYASIKGNTFKYLNTISPLITVDSGSGYSNGIMSTKVPVKIPSGHFAMGFLYDENKHALEGMLQISQDTNSVTVATRHFSSFFITSIDRNSLMGEIDSGFKPGIDDWQFRNTGTYILPEGSCSSMCLTAMWYYTEKPDGAQIPLTGRYDNNGSPAPKTPGRWQDDALSLKLIGMVMGDYEAYFTQDSVQKWVWESIKSNISDTSVWEAFALSILVTGEPQFLCLHSGGKYGHAVICYKVTRDALFIADPNYPGRSDIKIQLIGDKFEPYGNFNIVRYWGKKAIINWPVLAQRWSEFKATTIGNEGFPKYNLVWFDKKGVWHPLEEGATIPEKYITIFPKYETQDQRLVSGLVQVFRELATQSEKTWGASNDIFGGQMKPNDPLELKAGKNNLGIALFCNINQPSWVDFKYINIYCCNLSIIPETSESGIGIANQFIAQCDPAPANATYIWKIDGREVQNGPKSILFTTFSTQGISTVSVTLRQEDKDICTANAIVTVRSSTLPPNPAPEPEHATSFVTNVTTNVTPPSYKGQCPVTLNFSAVITANGPCSVTYAWENSLGGRTERNIIFSKAGSQTVNGPSLSQSDSGKYWWRVHILTPNDIKSNDAVFEVNCCAVENADFTGKWDVSGGSFGGYPSYMYLIQSGNQVTGHYDYQNGRITGTVSCGVFTGTWAEEPSYGPPHDSGPIEFSLSKDSAGGIVFNGHWAYANPATEGSGGYVSGKKVP